MDSRNGKRRSLMENHESSQADTGLAYKVGNDADATQIADAIVLTWQEINTTLIPILGERGVAALYHRSLYLTSSAHSWLAETYTGIQTPMDLEALKRVIAQQTSANAVAGGAAVLQTFYGLLASLVGPLLTERLLRSVWANSFSGGPALDTTP